MELSYEELKRKAILSTFVKVPVTFLVGVTIAHTVLNNQLPSLVDLSPYLGGVYIGTTCAWFFRSEENHVARERRRQTKKSKKSNVRIVLENSVAILIIFILLLLLSRYV
ncbi:hypothetical protein HUG20_03245 [Salicibibacter cibi]|uniref:Uncharacterized protein n=1 Tax=Salicibibacter cibi TaxID=2743001 RepID=A0A7T6Z8Y3_9BACI|nr:hypothetical protein [Salicibibacter cibi]QQK79011.1 hypothetical protein HUG20_03245 [Salicibibacter cibi]